MRSTLYSIIPEEKLFHMSPKSNIFVQLFVLIIGHKAHVSHTPQDR